MMDHKPVDPLLAAYFGAKDLDRVQNYLTRGRSYALTPTPDLHVNWISAFKLFAKIPETPDPLAQREYEDIESELSLRGETPNLEVVTEDIKRLGAAAHAFVRDLSPQEKSEIEQELETDIAAALGSSQAHKN